MWRDPYTRKMLSAIKRVLDKAKPTAPSANFDQVVHIVNLGLWDPERPRRIECSSAPELDEHTPHTDEHFGDASTTATPLRN